MLCYRGGIILTVEGEHLDSVFLPIMQVHMEQRKANGSIFRDVFESVGIASYSLKCLP